MKLSLIFSIFLSINAFASQSSPIFKCKIKNDKWNAQFILDGIGAGILNFKTDNKSHTCGLRIEFLEDSRRAIKPKIKIVFNRGACEPTLGDLEKEIFNQFIIHIHTQNSKNPEAHVQWLKKRQPEACTIEKFDLFALNLNTKKWLEGKWGRNLATEPSK